MLFVSAIGYITSRYDTRERSSKKRRNLTRAKIYTRTKSQVEASLRNKNEFLLLALSQLNANVCFQIYIINRVRLRVRRLRAQLNLFPSLLL